jgi:hypothetical protein
MPNAVLTIDELVAVLQRSSLPTVLVEGEYDLLVYRRFEKIIGSGRADFLPCGGRDMVLAMYERRAEFSNIKSCFVADNDMWLFTGVPRGYGELIRTHGYSIENDVYEDANLERLLHEDEVGNHAAMIRELSRWFAFQVERCLQGHEYLTDPHLYHLIPVGGYICSADVLAEHGYVEPPADRYKHITEHYQASLRGKLLYEVIVRFSHAPHRVPKYSYDVLWEISVVYGLNGPHLTRLLEAICLCLDIPAPNRQLPLQYEQEAA